MADYPDWTTLMQIIGSDITLAVEISDSDITLDVNISTSDIQVPVDIQGAYIQMPVDIQGQYITLDIDIVAQSIGDISIDIAAQSVGNLDINLAASDVTIDVNISTSDVTIDVNLAASDVVLDVNISASDITLDVDITAQTVGDLTININAQSVGIDLEPGWEVAAGNSKTFYGLTAAAVFGGGGTVLYTVPAGKTLYIYGMSFQISAQLVASADLNQMGNMHLTNNTTASVYCLHGGNGGAGENFLQPAKFTAGQVMQLGWTCRANHNCFMSATCWGYEV